MVNSDSEPDAEPKPDVGQIVAEEYVLYEGRDAIQPKHLAPVSQEDAFMAELKGRGIDGLQSAVGWSELIDQIGASFGWELIPIWHFISVVGVEIETIILTNFFSG